MSEREQAIEKVRAMFRDTEIVATPEPGQALVTSSPDLPEQGDPADGRAT